MLQCFHNVRLVEPEQGPMHDVQSIGTVRQRMHEKVLQLFLLMYLCQYYRIFDSFLCVSKLILSSWIWALELIRAHFTKKDLAFANIDAMVHYYISPVSNQQYGAPPVSRPPFCQFQHGPILKTAAHFPKTKTCRIFRSLEMSTTHMSYRT